MEPSEPSATYTKCPLGCTTTVMGSVRPRSNGAPATAAPRAPVVALIGKTLTLVPEPLASSATRNLGTVGFLCDPPQPISVQATSNAAERVTFAFMNFFSWSSKLPRAPGTPCHRLGAGQIFLGSRG